MNNTNNHAEPSRGPVDHNVRDLIIIAATEHFRVLGYEKTTVSGIAKAIGFSKAYIYKFFDSKQAIAEHICVNCLLQIETEIQSAIDRAEGAQEKLRCMFKVACESSVRLFFDDKKIYAIAAFAAKERWGAVCVFERRMQVVVQEVLRCGRASGDFEHATPLDEASVAIYLTMRPYINPVLLQYNLDNAESASVTLSNMVIRSLSTR